VREGARVRLDVLRERLLRVDVVHEPDLERFVGGQELSRDHHVERPGLTDQPGQALGPAGAGKDPQRDLGEPDLPGILRHHAQVGRERDLEPAADAVSVDRRDDDLRSARELVERFLAVEAEHRLEIRLALLQHLDVRAGAEEARHRAREHDDAGVLVEPELFDGRVHLLHHGEVVGVRLRLADLDVPDVVVGSGPDVLALHGRLRPPAAVAGGHTRRRITATMARRGAA